MKSNLKKVLKKILKPMFKIFDPMQIVNVNGHSYIGDMFGLNFKDYMYENNMKEIQQKLEKDLDEESIEIIRRKIEIFKNFPLWNTVYSKNIRSIDKNIIYNGEEIKQAKKFIEEIPKLKSKYHLKTYIPEVVYYHHGLKLVPEKVLQYIENKIFLDCGASYGDSATIFIKDYSPSLVKSFEMTDSPTIAQKEYITTLKDNGIVNKYEFISKGVTDNCDNVLGCEMTTIDNYLSTETVGLIKMDIEGAAPFAINGAVETIKRDRPVLLIACYHTPKEFFEIKPFLESLDLNYKFMFRNLNLIDNFEHETTLICVPREVF